MAIVTTGGLIDNPASSTVLAPAQWAIAAGTADAITGAYTTPNTSLPDGLLLGFRASAANATTTPTFSPDGLPSHPITVRGGVAVQIGDIPGAGAEMLVRYKLASTRWELLNPQISRLPPSFFAGATGSADAITATFTPAHPTVPVDGTIIYFRATAINTTTTPTLSVDGSTPVNIIRYGGIGGTQPGDILPGRFCICMYDAADTSWVLLNPAQPLSPWAVAGGTADALTLTGQPFTGFAGGVLTDGLEIRFRAASANATTTPTLNLAALGAKTIVKRFSTALAAGDMVAGGEYTARYNLANTRWVLMNPVVN